MSNTVELKQFFDKYIIKNNTGDINATILNEALSKLNTSSFNFNDTIPVAGTSGTYLRNVLLWDDINNEIFQRELPEPTLDQVLKAGNSSEEDVLLGGTTIPAAQLHVQRYDTGTNFEISRFEGQRSSMTIGDSHYISLHGSDTVTSYEQARIQWGNLEADTATDDGYLSIQTRVDNTITEALRINNVGETEVKGGLRAESFLTITGNTTCNDQLRVNDFFWVDNTEKRFGRIREYMYVTAGDADFVQISFNSRTPSGSNSNFTSHFVKFIIVGRNEFFSSGPIYLESTHSFHFSSGNTPGIYTNVIGQNGGTWTTSTPTFPSSGGGAVTLRVSCSREFKIHSSVYILTDVDNASVASNTTLLKA